jgi:(S)-ureidoglycine aminohydrolase
MYQLYGHTRDTIKRRYALRTPEGYVPSWVPGWEDCIVVIHISPEMGAKFTQWQVTFGRKGEGRGTTGVNEYVVYVLEGRCAVAVPGKNTALTVGSFVYLPPDTDFHFKRASAGTRLLVFEKKYQPLAGCDLPGMVVGHQKSVAAKPFLGNKDARLQVLLPEAPAFDMAVNIFTYQPGATLPFVETHIMEHGLLMLKGQGVYRLGADWHPVQAGDVIWMAPYCPQWFVAMGPTPASYIYYKDVNRPPLD